MATFFYFSYLCEKGLALTATCTELILFVQSPPQQKVVQAAESVSIVTLCWLDTSKNRKSLHARYGDYLNLPYECSRLHIFHKLKEKELPK